MCARHDITIGRYLFELEPVETSEPGHLLLYLRIVDQADGDVCWQGAARFWGNGVMEADIYGGQPYSVDSHTREVQSD